MRDIFSDEIEKLNGTKNSTKQLIGFEWLVTQLSLKLDRFQALRDKTLYVRPATNREAWWHPRQITPEAHSHCILAGDVNVMSAPSGLN